MSRLMGGACKVSRTVKQYKASPVNGAAIQSLAIPVECSKVSPYVWNVRSLAISVEHSKVSPYWWSVQSVPCLEHS
jgi:hypothetical protein